MNRALTALTAAALACAAHARPPGPPGPPPGGRYAAPPGYWAGGYRPVYPGWRAGYWGPRAGIYVGGPGYWGPWPYGWGASYTVPYNWVYAAPPLPYVWPATVAAPAPQVIVQPGVQPAAAESGAASYWYYCTEPAGYYPYVPQCGQPWMKVVPQVPGSHGAAPQLAP